MKNIFKMDWIKWVVFSIGFRIDSWSLDRKSAVLVEGKPNLAPVVRNLSGTSEIQELKQDWCAKTSLDIAMPVNEVGADHESKQPQLQFP